MRGQINQPETQKWLTNVISVSYDVKNLHFEIACYVNKVRAFRSGVEKNIEQVLQTDTIFNDMVQGEVSSTEKLLEGFGTTDKKTICELILQKGKIQLSEQERQAEQDRLIKEIVTIICQRTTCPDTGLPYPAALIEQTIKNQLNYSPNSFPASEQAAALIK